MAGIWEDENAKASFSAIAVIILVLTVFTSVHMARIEQDRKDAATQSRTLEEMERAAEDAHAQLSAQSEAMAQEVVESCLNLGWGAGGGLPSLNEQVQGKFSQYTDANFNKNAPRAISSGGEEYTVYVKDAYLDVYPVTKCTSDIVLAPVSLDAAASSGTRSGSAGEGANYNDMERFDTESPNQFANTNRSAYIALDGQVTYVVRNNRTGIEIEKTQEIKREAKSPLLLLAGSFSGLSKNSQGEMGELGRTVRYILSTIAQYRAIEGLGAGERANGTGYADVLSERDVEAALNIGFILLEGRYYRAFDEAALAELYARLGILNKTGMRYAAFRAMIYNYTASGTVDPSDLYAIFSGMQGQELDVRAAFAQSAYATMDQYVLKFFDYLDVPAEDDPAGCEKLLGNLTEKMNISQEMEYDKFNAISRNETVDMWFCAWNNDTALYSENSSEIAGEATEQWRNNYSVGRGANVWYCKNSTSDFYENDSSEELAFYIPNTNDMLLSNITESSIGVSFKCLCSFEDTSDFGKIRISWSDENQTELGNSSLFTGAGNLFTENYTINATGHINKTLRVAFQFSSDSSESGRPWEIWNVFFVKSVIGYNATKQQVQINVGEGNLEPINISDKSFNVTESAANNISGSRNGSAVKALRDTTQSYVRQFIEGVSKYVFDNIFVMINGGERPKLLIDPKDNASLVDACRNETLSWISAGFSRIREWLDNPAELINQTFAKLAAYVVDNFVKPIQAVLSDKIAALGGALNDTINSWKGFIDGLMDNIVVKEAVNIIENVLNILSFGGYSTMKEWVSRLLGDTKNIDWGNLFNTHVLAPVSTALAKAGEFVIKGISTLAGGFFAGIKPLLMRLVDLAESLALNMAGKTLDNGEINNLKFLQEMRVGAPFELWDGDYSSAKENGTIERETLSVRQNKSYLDGANAAISLSRPSGMHYVSLTEYVDDPYTTQWDIDISADNALFTRNARPDSFTGLYTWYNDTTHIRLSFSVIVSTGWAINGVNYNSTHTLLEDSNKFLNDAKDAIQKFVDEVMTRVMGPVKGFLQAIDDAMDGFQRIIDAVSSLISTLVEKGTEFVKLISQVFQKLVVLLESFARTVLDGLAAAIINLVTTALSSILGHTFELSLFGLTFRISLADEKTMNNTTSNETQKLIETSVLHSNFNFAASINRLNQTARARSNATYDLLVDGWLSVSQFYMGIKIDPLIAVNNYTLEGRGRWSEGVGGYYVNVTLPYFENCRVDKEYVMALDNTSFSIPDIYIPPLGVKVHINMGFVVRYINATDFKKMVNDAINEAINSTNFAAGAVLADAVGFVQTLVSRIVNNIISRFLGYVEGNVTHFTAFVDLKVNDAASGSAGGGVRLSFMIDNGTFVKEILSWLIGNIAAYFESLTSPSAKVTYPALSNQTFEHMFVLCEFYFSSGSPDAAKLASKNARRDSLSVIQFNLNAPFAASIFMNRDIGRSKGTIGFYQEKVPSEDIVPMFSGTNAEKDIPKNSLVNLWLFRMEITEITAAA